MARKLKSDRVLLTATVLLVCVSIVMVYSASALVALQKFDQPNLFVTKQALWTVLGLAVLTIAMRIDYRTYRNEAFIWSALALVTLMLIGVMFSTPVNGTRRWFGIGGLGIQPSELAKIVTVLFTALILERRMHRIDELRYSMLPIVIVVVPLMGLILLQPDFGTAMTLVLIVAAMVFAAGLNYRYLVGAALAAAPAIYLLLMRSDYRRRRVFAFLDPWADPQGDGFQIIQSLLAVGSGGLLGRGLMSGVQKLYYLPEPHTDFIYAVIGEELGLVGTASVLLAYVVLFLRGLKIAGRAPDRFGFLLAAGLTVSLAVYVGMNISVVTGIIPTTGLPLPFLSYGGSALVVNLGVVGVLLNVASQTKTGIRTGPSVGPAARKRPGGR